jgi:cytochrome b
MNELPASSGPVQRDAPAAMRVLVWDLPVRVFHWLTVFCFAGAYLSAESDDWRLLHVTLGYTMGGLVLFRILWGFIGTRYARFSDFVHGPARVRSYLRALAHRDAEQHYVGHNPAGALAIVALLALALAVTASGWALYHEIGGKALEEVHEAAANIMLALVGLHVAAVLLSSRLHHENLVAAMFSGCKPGRPGDAIRHAWRGVAALMLVAVLVFWWWQWHSAPIVHGSPPVSMMQAIRR